MYDEIEIAFADAPRLLRYKLDDIFGAEFSLKGFDYPWILQSRKWRNSDKVLDVGAGYSMLPAQIADNYGCEVWALDDFGESSDEQFWKRNKEPREHIAKYPQIKYVLERLGNVDQSSLPINYFDCIYSASTLEHVPTPMAKQVWSHMDKLLKPGGEMLHAVDLKLPSHRGLISLLKATLIDVFRILVPKFYMTANLYYTPSAYLSVVSSAIDTRISTRKWRVGFLRMVLDPEIVFEPLDWAYNRIVKDDLTEIPFLRV
ncbi:MAG: class I SAM-dependent methyltransferase, partial [Anaerolineales bacterium]|nr:class I SAM-dependent methyltransferase [Anaerolineales bacterium]